MCVPTICLPHDGEDLRAAAVRRTARAARGLCCRGRPCRVSTCRRSCPFASWEELAAARADPAAAGAGADADAIEGVMLKRREQPLRAGPAEGPVVEVEARSVHIVDAVMMYAQRGTANARRSIPTTRSGSGGATRATNSCRSARPIPASRTKNSRKLDRYVRNNTTQPLRPGAEVADGTRGRASCWRSPSRGQRSTRHKSGVAMRFPRISASAGTNRPRRPTASTCSSASSPGASARSRRAARRWRSAT